MRLWLGLAAQFGEFLSLALAVAEDLIAAGEGLRRAVHPGAAVPGCRPHREERVDEMRSRQRDQVGAAGRQDGVDLIGRGDRADAHGREPRLVADLIREWSLIHSAVYRLRIGDDPAR